MLRYICLSDLHAGATTSLLSHVPEGPDPSTPSPTTTTFATALGDFLAAAGTKPGLILLGDVLDLQFSDRATSFLTALGFLKALKDTGGLSGEVIATAGNHDHALWTDARLSVEAATLRRSDGTPTYLSATRAWSSDTEPPATSPLLTSLLERAGFDAPEIRYPNIGFGDRSRAVLLHHGHFVEAPYHLISTILDRLGTNPGPLTVERLSAENAGWIDFFWSTFGDAADLGPRSEALYQKLLTSVGFRNLTARWAEAASDALGERLPLSGDREVRAALHAAIRIALDASLGAFRDSERQAVVDALTTDGRAGLTSYIAGPTARQITGELDGPPDDLTFVFGHTHKPFSDRVPVPGLSPVKVYNTGGWPLNGPRLDNAEGAAMVLISDDFRTASVRLFKTPDNGIVPVAHLDHLGDGSAGDTAFRAEVQRWLNESAPAWDNLATVVGDAYRARQDLLLGATSRAFGAAAE
ncbi:hypothetical protein GQ651_17905 [Alphaproteobacteria bacterium GH1-50]|uniref:Calcineurin-like phosphoesterase family protein n=1 Tax=Kangsaoukella pontilimi TaxID=2691042 RepID=A0A7C9III4_9RHOB|nr:hypothetical protein [Kangsaoukella pontilimi]MXQ09724.1 hypothetical protein [Kangsaoukella pontilimi]